MKEKSSPLVSIITLTYNRAHHLPDAIESVLKQSFHDFEFIIVDDGSTDDTEAVVNKYSDQRIRYHYIDHIGSISKLRNKAMELAKGEYIAFLDSDDIWEVHKLKSQLEDISHFRADAAFSKSLIFFDDGLEKLSRFSQQLSKHSTKAEIIDKFVMNELMVYTSSLIFKRTVLEKLVGFDTFLSISEMEFISRLIAHFKVISDPTCLVRIRKHRRNNSTLTEIERSFSEKFFLLKNFNKFGLISNRDYEKAMFIHYHAMILSHNPSLSLSKSLKYFLKGLKMRPFSLMNIRTLLSRLKIMIIR